MALGEFELIARYFQRPQRQPGPLVAQGIGDDCALLQPEAGMQLAISCDMLVAGRHFFPDVDPAALGHKALAVNLSDLAACGATPLAFTLALALPEANDRWLDNFCKGLFHLADTHCCSLIGGDTTRGPLNICITVFGQVPRQAALLRSGAQVGDDIWVSGTLGDARLALDIQLGRLSLPPAALNAALQRLERPTPRVELGQALRGVANAAIDVSDGLIGDLGHILKASGVGATLDTAVVSSLLACRQIEEHLRLDYTLAGGDDYELLFTAPASSSQRVLGVAQQTSVPVTRIGRIDVDSGLRLLDAQGQAVSGRFASFDHFQ